MRPTHRLLTAILLALALSVAGASAASARQPGQQQPPEGQANLRAFHAVPGMPAVDVFVDGDIVFSSVRYEQATNYAVLPAGRHSVRIIPAGTGLRGQALIDTTIDLPADSYNTLAAVGEPDRAQALELVNGSTLPTTNQARVRVVHASPDAPVIDVAVRGGPVLFSNISFPSASDYQVVDAQAYTLEIRQAGTGTVLRTIPNVNLNGGTVYSIYAVGRVDGQPPLEVVPVVDAPPLAVCRTLVSPGVGAQATPTTAPAAATATPQARATQTQAPRATRTPSATATVTATVTATSSPTATATPQTETPTVTTTPQATATPQTETPSATVASETPTGTPQETAEATPTPVIGTPQAMFVAGTTSAPVQVGLSLAAVLGGLALSRRLF